MFCLNKKGSRSGRSAPSRRRKGATSEQTRRRAHRGTIQARRESTQSGRRHIQELACRHKQQQYELSFAQQWNERHKRHERHPLQCQQSPHGHE